MLKAQNTESLRSDTVVWAFDKMSHPRNAACEPKTFRGLFFASLVHRLIPLCSGSMIHSLADRGSHQSSVTLDFTWNRMFNLFLWHAIFLKAQTTYEMPSFGDLSPSGIISSVMSSWSTWIFVFTSIIFNPASHDCPSDIRYLVISGKGELFRISLVNWNAAVDQHA